MAGLLIVMLIHLGSFALPSKERKKSLPMLPSPLTMVDMLSLLYPHGRLRTSRAEQGLYPRTDWNAFALAAESGQARTDPSSAYWGTSDTLECSPTEND